MRTPITLPGAHDSAHHANDAHHADSTAPPYWTVIPFIILLGAIAALPLLNATEHWWEKNSNRFKVAASLGLLTLCYYAFSTSLAR